jgi:hypothetical protein
VLEADVRPGLGCEGPALPDLAPPLPAIWRGLALPASAPGEWESVKRGILGGLSSSVGMVMWDTDKDLLRRCRMECGMTRRGGGFES